MLWNGGSIFSALCKKDKNMSCVKPYFNIKFYPFYLAHMKSRFVKRLSLHIGCEEVYATYFFDFFFNN
jgi:hypothetical protein